MSHIINPTFGSQVCEVVIDIFKLVKNGLIFNKVNISLRYAVFQNNKDFDLTFLINNKIISFCNQ